MSNISEKLNSSKCLAARALFVVLISCFTDITHKHAETVLRYLAH